MVKKLKSIRIEDWLWKEIEEMAKKSHQDRSKFIRNAVIEKIQRIERSEFSEKNTKIEVWKYINNLFYNSFRFISIKHYSNITSGDYRLFNGYIS